ncbi:hypothetical protein [Desulfovibrio inopinatus]|uniref:hypothetical protein n=1 Tax=Desulfovibrio inopinatus TaxID=102109 RepID=UPI000411865E|nr:hypothetical protein [Desulfovibrio inopinatus]
MGVFVGAAFLAGVLGKVAHEISQRKKVASGNVRNESGAEKKIVPDHNQSAKKW